MLRRRPPLVGWLLVAVTSVIIWTVTLVPATPESHSADEAVVEKFFSESKNQPREPIKKHKACTPCAERQAKGKSEPLDDISDILGARPHLAGPAVNEVVVADTPILGTASIILGNPKRQHRVKVTAGGRGSYKLELIDGKFIGDSISGNQAGDMACSSAQAPCDDLAILLEDLRLISTLHGKTHRIGTQIGNLALTECTQMELVWTDGDGQGEILLRLSASRQIFTAERIRVTSFDGQQRPHRSVLWFQAQ